MAKIKPVGGKKRKKKKSAAEAIPCFILIISGIGLLALLFYAMLSSA